MKTLIAEAQVSPVRTRRSINAGYEKCAAEPAPLCRYVRDGVIWFWFGNNVPSTPGIEVCS